LQDQDVFDGDSRTLRLLGVKTLDRSEQLLRKKKLFIADRLLASATAMEHAIEAAQRLSDASAAPSREHASQRLETVYFRAQQADYFAERSGEPDAATLPQIASRWYQKALRFLETDPGTSENYADAAASVVSALENLAQANVPASGSGKAR